MGGSVAVVSFRFGPTDGVSVVTRTWIDALAGLGWEVGTVAGSDSPWPDVAHRRVEGLGIDDAEPPAPEALEAALAGADLVVVENALTIPLRLDASRVLASVLAGRPALLHHHDPPWHRPRFAHVRELPATDPAWRHVAITRMLADELAARGVRARVIRNGFPPPRTRTPAELARLRATTRSMLDVDERTRLVAHPVRAIERKNLPAAIALTEAIGGTYWLLGPAEEGYAAELARLLDAARCPVRHRAVHDVDAIYAAADHVVFPSTWEGFGNPPIEAALRRRTVTVGTYPVADELRALGFEWFGPDDVEGVARALDRPEDPAVVAMLDRNERTARVHLGTERVRAELSALLDEAGWCP
jgi:glycosyltransferase involved in cell wall biosynthesis